MTPKDILKQIRLSMFDSEITMKELAEKTKINIRTLQRRFEHPCDFKLCELIMIIEILNMHFNLGCRTYEKLMGIKECISRALRKYDIYLKPEDINFLAKNIYDNGNYGYSPDEYEQIALDIADEGLYRAMYSNGLLTQDEYFRLR